MGIFQTLSNDISGAGQAIGNGIGSAFHAVADTVSSGAHATASAGSSVYHDLSNSLGTAGNYLSQNAGLNRYAFSPQVTRNTLSAFRNVPVVNNIASLVPGTASYKQVGNEAQVMNSFLHGDKSPATLAAVKQSALGTVIGMAGGGLNDGLSYSAEAPVARIGEPGIPNGIEPGSAVRPQTLTKSEANLTAKTIGLKGQPDAVPAGTKPLGLVDTIKSSGQTTPGMRQATQGGYNAISNDQAVQAATQRIASDPNGAYQFALNNHNAEANTTAIMLAKHFEQNGQPDIAANLMIQKAKQALQAGQGNQVYSMWDKLSPETIAQTAAKTIEQYNQGAKQQIPGLTPEQYQSFVDQAKAIQGMPEGRDKGLATQKVLEQIGRLIPSSTGDKAFALYRTGLLTGFRTPGKIVLSHAISNATEAVKNVPAAIADQAMSAITGERSLVATPKGMVGGFTKGGLAAVDNLIHGYETPGSGGMSHDFTSTTNFPNTAVGHIAQTYVDTVSRLHGSLYKPFFGSQHLNSLMDIALTNARNQGLSGADKQAYMSDFVKQATDFSVKNPDIADPHADFSTPEGAAARATAEAQYTTFQNKTLLSQMASGMKKGNGNPTKYVTPFTQIPSSIAMKLIDYSPVGPVKEVIQQIRSGSFDQRSLAQALGRGITGIGIAAIGYTLYQLGKMTLSYPTDPKTQAEWQLEGKQANSILLGGKWHQLSSFGPAGDTMAVGGAVAQGLQGSSKTPGNVANAAISGGLQGVSTLASSPYLQGITNLGNAISQPGTKAQKFAEGLAGGIIPTGIANIATATDPLQRQTNNIADSVTNKIPGLRETNLPVTNVLGKEVPRGNGEFGSLFDPTYASKDTSTPLTGELDNLSSTGNSATPTYSGSNAGKVGKTISVLGVTHSLTPEQSTELQTKVGNQIQPALEALMRQPEYQAMNNADKQNALSNLETTVKDRVYQKYVADNQLPVPMGTKLSASALGTQNLIPALKSGNAAKIQEVMQSIPFADRTTAYNDAMKIAGQSQLSATDQLSQDLSKALGQSVSSPSSTTLKSSTGTISGKSKLLTGAKKVSGGTRQRTGGKLPTPKAYKPVKTLTIKNAAGTGTTRKLGTKVAGTQARHGVRRAVRTRLPRYTS